MPVFTVAFFLINAFKVVFFFFSSKSYKRNLYLTFSGILESGKHSAKKMKHGE